MKIAILSDFHIGYERFTEDAYRQASEALGKAAELADVLLIPGDIFDMRNPKPEAFAEAVNLFRDISKRQWGARVASYKGKGRAYTNIPVIAIAGTHERRAQDAENPVSILNLAAFLVDISQATVIVEKGSERVAVCGVGGVDDQRFGEVLRELSPKPVEGVFSIFMFHESVYELLPFNEEFVRLDDLPDGFDLYVSGHIHSRVEERVHGKPLLIPGSTVLTQLKEGEQEPKGFFVYDTEQRRHEFHRINSRPFRFAKLNVEGLSREAVIAAVKKTVDSLLSGQQIPIIKIVLEGSVDSGDGIDLDLHGIIRGYSGRAVVEISKSGTEEKLSASVADAKVQLLDTVSIKDQGIGMFLQKFKEKGGELRISPVELFELLSADKSKEKIMKEALEELL